MCNQRFGRNSIQSFNSFKSNQEEKASMQKFWPKDYKVNNKEKEIQSTHEPFYQKSISPRKL